LEDEAEPEEAFEGGALTTGVAETVDIVEAEDVTEGRDVVEGDEKARGGGLSPPAPSSVDPSGMPTGLTDDRLPIPAGDEADAAGCNNVLLPPPVHAPDAVPVRPPPSKSAVEPDAPDVELSMPEHVPPESVVPDTVGLTPGDASSVAPRGMPVAATGEPGPIPSGDVNPSPGAAPESPTCAKAGLQTKSAAVITTINERVSVGFFPLR
jgi:hypothetical protein